MTPADTMRDGNLTPAGDKVGKVAQDGCDKAYERELRAKLLQRADECRAHAEASRYPRACSEYRAKEAAFREAAAWSILSTAALADRQPDQRGGEVEALIAELTAASVQASSARRMIAEAKSLRQADNQEGRADLYSWPTPEQTLEGRAAAALAAAPRPAEQGELEG